MKDEVYFRISPQWVQDYPGARAGFLALKNVANPEQSEALQLRGEAGRNQIPAARTALVQAFSGPAAVAVTHVLQSMDR